MAWNGWLTVGYTSILKHLFLAEKGRAKKIPQRPKKNRQDEDAKATGGFLNVWMPC
jgi:hypothetical protein